MKMQNNSLIALSCYVSEDIMLSGFRFLPLLVPNRATCLC